MPLDPNQPKPPQPVPTPRSGAQPVIGASMTPTFATPQPLSDQNDINAMLGQQPETAFLQPPAPTPTPTPTPMGAFAAAPGAKTGYDYFRALFGR